jgi:phosphoribosylaminoimidazolecarboxamide formyltransferase / IMP cyclohydrolase
MSDVGRRLAAIVSVSDAAGLEVLGRALAEMGADIYSTGGTKAKLEAIGVEAHSVSDLTGFPEILGGRVKTLHPHVHGGLLARRDDPSHMAELEKHGLREIGLVAVNLYPFAQTVAREGVTLEEAVEQIDIGGPTLLRAAAKNFAHVVVLSDPADYAPVLQEWRSGDGVSLETRKRLAAKAFAHVSEYDTVIARYLGGASQQAERSQPTRALPQQITLNLSHAQALRYGENPHQQAALYRDGHGGAGTLVGSLKQLHGPELSYNNLLDADAALALVRDYHMPTVAIIKHATPCGIACGGDGDDLADIYDRALASDPTSAFGGIIGINRPVDGSVAHTIAKTRFDVLVAPHFTEEAIELLARKKNLRLLAVEAPQGEGASPQWAYRQISGGFLVQSADGADEEIVMEPVTLRRPTLEEIADLTFAWRAVKHVRSNAIVLARKLATVGIGGGQTSRVDAVRIATQKAGEHAIGSVMASDAFFPFPDGIEAAAQAGVTAIIQPGGSVNDDAVIESADVAGLAMVFTGRRHFRH